jgi:hypothetical protein
MNVYLAGPIKGRSNYHEKFAEAADKLRMEGYTVFNPAAANQEGRPLRKIMAYLLTWYWSGGARVEWLLARYLKLKIIYL